MFSTNWAALCFIYQCRTISVSGKHLNIMNFLISCPPYLAMARSLNVKAYFVVQVNAADKIILFGVITSWTNRELVKYFSAGRQTDGGWWISEITLDSFLFFFCSSNSFMLVCVKCLEEVWSFTKRFFWGVFFSHNCKMVQAINKAKLSVGLQSCRLLTRRGRCFPSPNLSETLLENYTCSMHNDWYLTASITESKRSEGLAVRN